MRILQYTPTFLPRIGGAELVVHHLSEGLCEIGHEVHVHTLRFTYTFEPAAIRRLGRSWQRSYQMHYFRGMLPGLGRTRLGGSIRQSQIQRKIERLQPDIVHVHLALPFGHDLTMIGDQIGCPMVLTCHGIDIQKRADIGYGWRLNPEMNDKIVQTIHRMDRLVAIGNDVRNEYLRLGVPDERILQVANPIDCKRLAIKREDAKTKLGLPDDVPMILAVGRNHAKKGFGELLRAIAKIKEHNHRITCCIVGAGTERLRTLARELGIQEFVRTFEPADPVGLTFGAASNRAERQLESFYSAADVYSMSSKVESFGVVTTEAMAASIPVVAFRSPGSEDLVSDGESGFLVEQDNIEGFADRLESLLMDPATRQQMGDRAREQAGKFDRVRIAQDHLRAYESAARA